MVEKQHLIQALQSMGYTVEEGPLFIEGYGGSRHQVDIRVRMRSGYDIGFRKVGNQYQLIADWWGVRGISQKSFIQSLSQRYAYCATVQKLQQQGFEVVSEHTHQSGQVHVVLRRIV